MAFSTRKYFRNDEQIRAFSNGWDFLYIVTAVKDPSWNVGDSVALPDGREYTYAKSDGACYAGQGCEFTAVGYQAITALGAATAISSNKVTLAAGTHAAAAKDELAGGYIIIYPSGSTNNTVQFRGIVGNDASVANALTVLYLDASLIFAVSTSDTAEVFQNPFAAVHLAATAALAKAGVPAAYVSATGYYFWVQTRGFVWVAPQATIATNKLGLVWRTDGSVSSAEDGMDAAAAAYASASTQYAGFVVEGNAANIGPLIKLMS